MFKILKKFIVPLMCILFPFHGFAADTVKGDQEPPNPSFSFPIQAHVSSLYGNNVYVGAHPGQTGGGVAKNFALAGLSHGDTEFTPFAPEKIKLNGQENQNNPLFDTGIQLLSLIDQGADEAEHPVVVAENNLSTIYLFGRLTNSENLELASKQALVAPATPTSGIEQLVAGPRGHIFAAVKPNAGGNFGDVGSGIAYFLFGTIDKSLAFEQVETVPLDVTSNELKINPGDNDVTINAVTMHVNPDLGLLYVGLQVQSALISNGARAVVVGRIENNNLVLAPIAPSNVFAGGDQIVGTGVAGASVSIHEVKSMVTSTMLPYLIVRGGNGGAGATQNKIFALPLVSGNNNSALNGTIANKNADPDPVTHSIQDPATAQAEMPVDNNEPAVIVGGQELNVGGNITEMFVQGDSVFAQVDGNGGIFYSQALFDAKGKIKGWTNWRRFAGVTERVFGASLKRSTAELTFLTGVDTDNVMTVKRTNWSHGSDEGTLPLNNSIGSLGGVCGLFDFIPATPALHDISVLVATGSDGVVLAETGQDNGNVVDPNQGAAFNATQTFDNGTITQDLGAGGNPKIVIIKGGALDDVGSITAAEIARDGAVGNNGWLFCGGCNGLIVLSKADGTGWDPTANELTVGFDGLKNGMSFKKIGNYSFVRKLVSDGNFLYVLTDTQLDRIDLVALGLGNLSVTTLATNAQLTGNPDFGSLQDLIVSGKFALLATSEGLFRVGNGNDIRAAANAAAVGWIRVVIPEGNGPVTNLFAVSKTGRAQDVATAGDGQVYVLVTDRGNNRAQVNRFTVSDVSAGAIDGNTIVPFPDFFVQGVPSYFVNLGEFRDLFVTDGANNFHARAKELEQLANLKLLSVSIETRIGRGFNFLGARSVLVPVSLEESAAIATMVNNSAAGSWIIGDDRGVQVNE